MLHALPFLIITLAAIARRGRPAIAFGAPLFALIASPACAAEARDAPFRAAIILNIIRFVDFGPRETRDPLMVCFTRSSGAAGAIAQLAGQRVGTRPVAPLELVPGRLSRCDVVYLGAGTARAVAKVRKEGVLVIGDGADFVDAGGTIALVGSGRQIGFEANTKAARAAQLRLSSKLLRLAARVQ